MGGGGGRLKNLDFIAHRTADFIGGNPASAAKVACVHIAMDLQTVQATISDWIFKWCLSWQASVCIDITAIRRNEVYRD